MNNLMNFDQYSVNEEYDKNKHAAFDVMRKMHNSKGIQKFLHVMSLLDDFVHLDFKNIRNTYKNRAGYDKISDIVGELAIAMQVMKNEEGRPEFALFYDMQKYKIDVNKILDALEDEGVKKYLETDARGRRRIVEDNAELIALLRRYKRWLSGESEEGFKNEGLIIEKKKPSAGLTKKKKSEIVKSAKKGEDIGKKGKNFDAVAKKAAAHYGSEEKGKKVAAAAMWKNIHR